MSDDGFQERTEAPTPKRRREAREKGEVPRSQEVTTAFLLLMGALVVYVGSPPLGVLGTRLFRQVIQGFSLVPAGIEGASSLVVGIGWLVLAGMAPVLLALSAMALAAAGIQARGVLTVEPVKPKWERLDPIKTAKRIWGVQAVAQLAKSLLKLLIVGVAIYLVLRRAMDDLPSLAKEGPAALALLFRSYAARVLASAGLAYLFLALADYGFQLWQHERQLKMSKEQIRREHKETEGDQVMKVRRRTMGRALARRRMLLAVSDADVVITNPTHIAVALKYDPSEAPAPVVLAMGARKMAARIRQVALQNGIPVIENKPLARALWATARVGFPIPVELYVAVAEILAFVIKSGRRRRPWGGSAVV
ncbi:MAG: EscU/YscU/HrcU family type III secretion system export apparatus switch protein [Gemmatimonadota bacterium]|nr:EscU/YscU/HrcU family type III secretion system export apparatus switch protein [Gemmatimonadota bacterium]